MTKSRTAGQSSSRGQTRGQKRVMRHSPTRTQAQRVVAVNVVDYNMVAKIKNWGRKNGKRSIGAGSECEQPVFMNSIPRSPALDSYLR